MNKMKKNFLMFAALVATTVGFTACSSEDDLANAEQGQEQERGVVKTQFTISLPQGTSGTTRMASSTVQSTEQLEDFRGIKGIELYPFKTEISSTAPFPTNDTPIPSTILLVGATGNGKSGPSGLSDNTIGSGETNLYGASKSHLYQDVDIPIGTKSFMFYGEAAGTQAPEVIGKLNRSSNPTKLGEIVFSPAQIHGLGLVGEKGNNIAEYLTSIANASIETGTANEKKWTKTDNVALRSLFEQFTGENESGVLTNFGVRAGSWTDVKAALSELYKNLKAGSADTQETLAMKSAIRTKIVNSSYGVSVNTSDADKLDFSYSENTSYKDNNTNEVFPYPRDLGLPDGAAFIRWNVSSQAFEALANNTKTGTNFAPLSSYVYPASLYYRVLSNIKTSSTPKGTGTDVYNDNKTWTQILDYYNATDAETAAGYDNNSVSSKTRSIAIIDPVQYAVGRLDAKVVANSGTLVDRTTVLNSNNEVVKTGTQFTVNNAQIFKVTGILIGGQKAVDYKFNQCTGSQYSFYTIYDKSIKAGTGTTAADSIYLTNSESPTMYTLALETKSATALAQEDAIVKIAVEFENKSGKTIVGLNNEKIYPGCRFYLIGTLDPFSNIEQKYTGTDTLIKKAFVQDYKTTVTLKVANLNNAYNTLPDLTLPQLEMGLSVDLHWETGIIQTIDME